MADGRAARARGYPRNQSEYTDDARGRVYLELADATPAETSRGMALLKKVVG
ncbi:uncharacterized protein SOCEGT47_010930 [Sorangium cellulosum]|uniref:Uncharacterized protein n=1 Tax=Sorangium cellulosum TaxID=56 RepID=A0A4P2PVG2_SORCE|nr:hypothetical protein [Sorangium cellulosum]AUX20620.1 uncharacterized protein SOCEGT47_010930 [Sorangium cellulosum]